MQYSIPMFLILTEPYSIEQMQYLVAHIPGIKNPTDKAYLAFAALHPLRPEEVFGLKYGDVDWETNKISVQRAVTYPDRNQPVIKTTKTEASVRTIDLAPQIRAFIPKGPSDSLLIDFNPLAPCGARRSPPSWRCRWRNFNPLAPCGARPGSG